MAWRPATCRDADLPSFSPSCACSRCSWRARRAAADERVADDGGQRVERARVVRGLRHLPVDGFALDALGLGLGDRGVQSPSFWTTMFCAPSIDKRVVAFAIVLQRRLGVATCLALFLDLFGQPRDVSCTAERRVSRFW
jgi:hypothetical protein